MNKTFEARPLKIGLVLDDTLDTADGVQQYVLGIGRWLTAQGHDVHYLTGASGRTDIANLHALSRNQPVRFNGNRLSIPLPAARAPIRQLLQRERFDVLHVQMPYSPFMAGRVIAAAPVRTVVFGSFHIFPHSRLVRYGAALLATYQRRQLRRFDSVVSVSAAAQNFARDTFKLHTDVVPNVVDVARYAAAQPMPVQHDGPVIAYLGRLVPRKGCQTLLEAFVKSREMPLFHKAHLLICGKGPLETELKRYISQHELNDAVTFTGFVSEADKPRYLAAADIAVFPSTGGESFGIVLAEAMAAGRPVVLGADNEGYRTVLQDGPGLLFKPGDSDVLAERLQYFVQDAAAHTAAVAWQKQQARQYDVAVVGAELVRRYRAELRLPA